jgi:hypothetical protein
LGKTNYLSDGEAGAEDLARLKQSSGWVLAHIDDLRLETWMKPEGSRVTFSVFTGEWDKHKSRLIFAGLRINIGGCLRKGANLSTRLPPNRPALSHAGSVMAGSTCSGSSALEVW